MSGYQPPQIKEKGRQFMRLPHNDSGFTRLIWGTFTMGALFCLAAICLISLYQAGLADTNISRLLSRPYFGYVIYITLIQALLSVILSVCGGVLGAIALHRRWHWPLRRLILAGCFMAMIVPTTVAAISLLKLWGQSGFISLLGGSAIIPDRLGLWSVLLAHCFFNIPLIMRVCLSRLQSVPQGQYRHAALLRFSAGAYFRHIEWPAIRTVLPSVSGLVFLLCFTSFSLVLMLGGGPAITTMEVSIYTALRFDFDLSKAALLCVIQLVICAIILVFIKPSSTNFASDNVLDAAPLRADHQSKIWLVGDGLLWFGLVILLLVPLGLLIFNSDIRGGIDFLSTARFWSAFAHSVALAIGAATGAVTLAMSLAMAAAEAQRRHWPLLSRLVEFSHSLFLLVPALVLGTSFFILLRPYVAVFDYGFYIILLGNALLSLPFCYRILAPALLTHWHKTDRLCHALRLGIWQRFRLITLPALGAEFAFAFGLSAALSFGDLGIITLFGSQEFETLPYLLFQFMNRYGAAEADLLALVLLGSALSLYYISYYLIKVYRGLLAR